MGTRYLTQKPIESITSGDVDERPTYSLDTDATLSSLPCVARGEGVLIVVVEVGVVVAVVVVKL